MIRDRHCRAILRMIKIRNKRIDITTLRFYRNQVLQFVLNFWSFMQIGFRFPIDIATFRIIKRRSHNCRSGNVVLR